MDTRGNDRLRELLAAEYAIGTLRGRARRRFETWMRTDADLARRVARWHEHLQPLADALAPVAPPSRVWAAIEARLGHARVASVPAWYDRIAFWRGFSALALALAVFAIGVSLRPLPQPRTRVVQAMPDMVATIADPGSGRPVAVVMRTASSGALMVKIAADVDIPAGQDLQLWIAPTDREPMESVGMVPVAAKGTAMPMPMPDDRMLARTKAFGLSLEPAGGSPQPTHVLGLGALMRLAG